MPGSTLTFAFILATLFGAAFHLIMGGDARRLALFLIAGWIGFGLGHLAGVALQMNIMNIGTLRLFPAGLGAVVALVAAVLLTARRPRKRATR